MKTHNVELYVFWWWSFAQISCGEPTGGKNHVAHCLPPIAYPLLRIPYCVSPIAFLLSSVAYRQWNCPLTNAHRLSAVAYHLSPIVCRLSTIAYRLWPIAYGMAYGLWPIAYPGSANLLSSATFDLAGTKPE